ncbi:MAG: hypothetical protein KBE25_00665 [Laribacter sp.]|nr:hypothetical protein [Laribacter sp.]MBP9607855.1 hypothetical protein [Laribacter sp.]
MPVQTNVATRVAYKKEADFGILPGATGGKITRRLTSGLNLRINQIESQEIRSDYQRGESRNGHKTVEGPLSGELSPGTYADFIGSALRRDFSGVTTVTGASITATTNKLTRETGSWLTDGIKVGMLIKPSSGANAEKMLTVIVATDLELTVAETISAHDAIVMDVDVPGKITFVPLEGHTRDSYTIEHWHANVGVSHQFTGCRINTISIDTPPDSIAKIDIGMMGQDRKKGSSAYFTNPAPATTTPGVTGGKGLLVLNGVAYAIVTGYKLDVDGGMTTGAVVGSDITPDVFVGPVTVKGTISAYFTGPVLDDMFTSETAATLILRLDDGSGGAITLTVPRAKLGDGSLSGDKEVIQQFSFTASPVPVDGAEQTSLQVQDTSA